jgi:hypothetical protein
MTEKIIPIPKTVLEKFLKPVSRITESCILKILNDDLYTICTAHDNTFFLYAKIKLPFSLDEGKLNLINIKKFLNGLNCLGNDGEFVLKLNSNNVECKMSSDTTNESAFFKYHLIDDGIIKDSTFSIKKIASLGFDTEFTITQDKIKKIISAYSFTTDVSKIYFYSDENRNVFCEINDRTMQNVDNLSMFLTDKLVGNDIQKPVPVNIEIFKNLIACKGDVKVKLNSESRIFIFQTDDVDGVELKYIISGLVK